MPIWYDVVFFKPSNVTVRRLPDGSYNFALPAGVTIQAVARSALPVDQSAQVAALTSQNATLTQQNTALAAQVAQLETALAECEAGEPPVPPTITGMTATPSNLPVGGGPVVVDAAVTGAGVTLSLKLDGVDVPGPIVLPQTVGV